MTTMIGSNAVSATYVGRSLVSSLTPGHGGGAPAGLAFVTTQNGAQYVTTNNGADRVTVKVS